MPEQVFIVFGSASDAGVFQPINVFLEGKKISSSVNVLSAHRTPKELEKALKKTKAKIFIAGAGLSAALPGVVASQTIKPVIGIACTGAFEGLDSFLATAQMPPGVPVLCVNVAHHADVARHVENYFSGLQKIVLVETPSTNKAVLGKAEEVLNKLGIPFFKTALMDFSDTKNVYLVFPDLHELESLPKTSATLVVVPVKISNLSQDAELFFRSAKNHLFVGLNRGENGALAVIQLANLSGRFDKKIHAYRKDLAKKVLDSNKELNKGGKK